MQKNPFVELAVVQDAEVCFIHFASRNKKAGKFHRYPTPPSSSNILVNCDGNSWYLDGITGLGNIKEGASYLHRCATLAGAKRVICIGSSMGAWGAAVFASELECELICFGPELWLNVYSGFSREDLSPTDLRVQSIHGAPSRSLIVSGIAAPSDIACANYFGKRWPACQTVYVRQCGHETARFLKNNGELENLIAGFAQSRDHVEFECKVLPVSEVMKFAPPDPSDLNRESLARFAGDLFNYLLVAEQLLTVQHLVARRMFLDAIPLVQRMRNEHGQLPELLLLHATCLRKAKRYQEALNLIALIETAPLFRQQALWLKAQIKEALGVASEANQIYRTLVSEHGKCPIVAAASQKLVAVA